MSARIQERLSEETVQDDLATENDSRRGGRESTGTELLAHARYSGTSEQARI